MFIIEVDPYINRTMELFHTVLIFLSDEATFYQKFARNVLFTLFAFSFPITIFIGAVLNENKYEALYLETLSVLAVILSMKAYYAYSKKKDFILFYNKLCVHSVSDENEFFQIRETLTSFRNFSISIYSLGVTSLASLMIACLYENALPIKLWFPYSQENKICFWIAYCYVVLNSCMAIAMIQFTTLM